MFMLMWYDASKTPLIEKIDAAILYYRRKYEKIPNLCLVCSKAIDKEVPKHKDLKIKVAPYILPNHLWLGIEEKDEK